MVSCKNDYIADIIYTQIRYIICGQILISYNDFLIYQSICAHIYAHTWNYVLYRIINIHIQLSNYLMKLMYNYN